MIHRHNLTPDMCRGAIACFEVRIMYAEKFVVKDLSTYVNHKMKLRQFGYSINKTKTHACIFDVLDANYLAYIQHRECLEYLLSTESYPDKYENIITEKSG